MIRPGDKTIWVGLPWAMVRDCPPAVYVEVGPNEVVPALAKSDCRPSTVGASWIHSADELDDW